MKVVDHDGRLQAHLLDGSDVALPDIGTDRPNAGLDGAGDALEPPNHGRLHPIGQHRQAVQLALLGLGADHSDKVAMPFEERNLVDAQPREGGQRVPLNPGGNPAVEDAHEGVIADILLDPHIGDRTVDQLEDQMAFVGFGVESLGIIPVEELGGGRLALAPGAAQALRPDAEVDHMAQNRQMPEQAWFVCPMALGDRAPTASAGRARQAALDGQDQLAVLGQFGLEHADIGDIE